MSLLGGYIRDFGGSLVVSLESLFPFLGPSFKFYQIMFNVCLYDWSFVCLLLCVWFGSWLMISMICSFLVFALQIQVLSHLSSEREFEAAFAALLASQGVCSSEHVFGHSPSIAFSYSLNHGETLVCFLTTNLQEDDSHLSG